MDAGPDGGDAGSIDATWVLGYPRPCPDAGFPLDISPVRLDNIAGLNPLASLVPPDHTFPTQHMYFTMRSGPDASATADWEGPVFSPASVVVDSIGLRHYDVLNGIPNYTDYNLTFSVCDDFRLYFIHVRRLTHAALVAALADGGCVPQGPGNEKACSFPVAIAIDSGQQIGTAGDRDAGVRTLDFAARDYRLPTGRSAFVNPDRWCQDGGSRNIYDRCYTVCPLDYLPAGERDPLLDGGLFMDAYGFSRTDEPRCGNIYQDIVGTAQGHWFAVGNTTPQTEAPHLFVGKAAYSNALASFSMGTSVPGLNAGQYIFLPGDAGTSVNRPFSSVTTSDVVCYERLYSKTIDAFNQSDASVYVGVTILTQLVDAGANFRVQKRDGGACGVGPWVFSGDAGLFER